MLLDEALEERVVVVVEDVPVTRITELPLVVRRVVELLETMPEGRVGVAVTMALVKLARAELAEAPPLAKGTKKLLTSLGREANQPGV